MTFLGLTFRLAPLYPGVFAAAMALSSSAVAKTEYRDIVMFWGVNSGGHITSGHDTAQDAVDAWNEWEERNFADCLQIPCAYCAKSIYGPPDRPSGLNIVNDKYRSLSTSSGTYTTFQTACSGTPANGPYVSPAPGSITAVAGLSCGSLSMRYRWLRDVVVEGETFHAYRYWCQNEVPDPPKCFPQPESTPGPKWVYGNPIDVMNAAKIQQETDYAAGDGSLRVGRTYTSTSGHWSWSHESGLADFTGRGLSAPVATTLVSFVKIVPPGVYYNEPVPAAIDTPRAFPLIKSEPDTGQKEVWIFTETGARVVYVEESENVFTTKDLTRPQLRLVDSPTGGSRWQFRSQRTYDTFDASGLLQQRVFADGKSLTYSRAGGVTTVTASPSGRSLIYANGPAAGQMSVTLPDATRLNYAVDEFQRVLSVAYPDGASKSYVYNEPENTGTSVSKPLWLTGTVDEGGVRLSTYTYDGTNPVSTFLAGGVNKYSVDYVNRAVTTPQNGKNIISSELGPDGERRITSQSQPAGSGCAASSSAVSYDAQGNVASRTDFKGTRTCYANDLGRNLETARVEGLSDSASCSSYTPAGAALPTGARKVSTEWHPDWRLPIRVAEPAKLTTSIYNGQPDPFNGGALASCAPTDALLPDGKPIAVLCRQVEQATTDANGSQGFSATLQSGVAAREERWTYNRWGQVLAHDGPRTDVNDVTTYAYYSDTSFAGSGVEAVGHTQGDLQSATNAAGQVTQYTKYNKHGQLLESIGPNGVVTTHTYDLRQRLLSTTEAGQITAYSYDAAGQLTRITWPDTSYLGYEYDPAHRQTAVFDHLGNRIEYTLDNAGNRIAENVKDPGGLLSRQLSRSIDALGRVQQTAGRE